MNIEFRSNFFIDLYLVLSWDYCAIGLVRTCPPLHHLFSKLRDGAQTDKDLDTTLEMLGQIKTRNSASSSEKCRYGYLPMGFEQSAPLPCVLLWFSCASLIRLRCRRR